MVIKVQNVFKVLKKIAIDWISNVANTIIVFS